MKFEHMKKINLLFLFIFFNLFLSLNSFSQDFEPPPEPDCWEPPCIPIDGGIVFLIAAGAAYGSKKIHDYKKQH
jgi:hypothetical protein